MGIVILCSVLAVCNLKLVAAIARNPTSRYSINEYIINVYKNRAKVYHFKINSFYTPRFARTRKYHNVSVYVRAKCIG